MPKTNRPPQMMSREAMVSATSTGLWSPRRRTPATPVMCPASAASRARKGTSWSWLAPSLRYCWPEATRSQPRSRASRVMASCSSSFATMSLPTEFWLVRKMPTCIGSAPELLRGEARALGHHGDLGPGDLGLHEIGPPKGGEAAVAPGHHPLASDDLRVAHDALRHQLRVLDEVGGGVEYAGDDHLVVGQTHLAEHHPLVLMPAVGALEGEPLRPRLEHGADDLAERDVAVVWSQVVAPAEMQAQPVGGDVPERVVERLDVALGDLHELRVGEIGEAEVAPHGEIGAVDLQHEPRAVDGVVLLLHHLHEPGEIGLAVREVLVGDEVRDDPGGGRGHECFRHRHAVESGAEVGDVPVHRRAVLPLDRAVAGGPRHLRELL